jgi:hypothetical protein
MNPELLLKNILTSGLSLTDPDLVRRFRVLNIFQLIFFIVSPALGFFYYYTGMVPLFYAVIVAGFLMLCGVLLLRMTKYYSCWKLCGVYPVGRYNRNLLEHRRHNL